MHKNQAAITRAYRERAKKAGRVQVSVMVPAGKAAELKAFAKQLRDGVKS